MIQAKEIDGELWIRAADHHKAIKEALAQPPEERNFCPRCGKRAGKNDWDVHTCTPPEEKNT